MPAMSFVGMACRGHGTGRPRRSYETPEPVAWMQFGGSAAIFPDYIRPAKSIAGMARSYDFYVLRGCAST
jgi:hypothetical protein